VGYGARLVSDASRDIERRERADRLRLFHCSVYELERSGYSCLRALACAYGLRYLQDRRARATHRVGVSKR
jgi:hypothetical protein